MQDLIRVYFPRERNKMKAFVLKDVVWKNKRCPGKIIEIFVLATTSFLTSRIKKLHNLGGSVRGSARRDGGAGRGRAEPDPDGLFRQRKSIPS